jgi:hypothetical protein
MRVKIKKLLKVIFRAIERQIISNIARGFKYIFSEIEAFLK